MSPLPQHGEPAGDTFLAIQELARTTGADVQQLLTLYALEGLLSRLAESDYRDDFVLKGGVLLAAFSLRRPTKDIDWQAAGLSNDVDDVLARVRELAVIEIDDGLIFDPGAISAHQIRDDDTYPGVRVRLAARLGKARVPFGIDVNFGDPIWPAPSMITLPKLVDNDRPPVQLLGYPLVMVIAEKTITILQRGEANTRWRDFADIATIGATHEIGADDLRHAFEAVGAYRGVALRELLPGLTSMSDTAQARWATWRRRHAYAESVPAAFEDVLRMVAELVDPVLANDQCGTERWRPDHQRWGGAV